MLQTKHSNPYVGPYAFGEEDADLFFGRDDEARRFLSLVVSERVVIFVSPSGAGKTSLLNVRLVPELRKKGYHVLPVARVGSEMTPGLSPTNVFAFNILCSLANGTADLAALVTQTLDGFLNLNQQDAAGESPARVLILDQFEEIFTTHPGRWEDRRSFFLQLRQALLNDPALSVVLALREDHLAGLEPFAPLLPGQLRNRFRLEPLHRDRAVDAVRRPAEVAGRPFDEGIAERLVENLSQEHRPGEDTMLPGELIEPVQLQVVCYQLWENLRHRPGETITEQDCRELGNVDQTLERFYDSAVEWAAKESQVPAAGIRRWCGTSLITPNRIRSQVSEEAGSLPREAAERLVERHLIRRVETRGSLWYELAHDRFIDPILQSNQKAQSPEATRLANDARAWDEAKREPSFLYRGQRLARAARTAEEGVRELTPLERDFLLASHKEEGARKSQRTRRILMATAASVIGLAASVTLSVYATGQRQIERREAWLATAQSRQLALEAMRKMEADPYKGLQLALESARQAATPEAEEALHRALSTPIVRGGLSLPIVSDSASAFAFTPDGSRFAMVTEKYRISLRDSKTGQQILTLPLAHSAINALEFSPTGDWLAAGDIDGLVTLYSAYTGVPIRILKVGPQINSIAFSSKDPLLAVASDAAEVTLWNPATGEKVKSLSGGHFNTVWDVAFNLDGTRLATAGENGLAIVWDVTSGRSIGEPLRHPQPVTGVAFSPNGNLATACLDHLIRVWDVQTYQGILKLLSGHQDWVLGVAYSPDGHYLASASFDHTARLWNAASGKELHTFSANGSVAKAVFKPHSNNSGISLAITDDGIDKGQGSITFWDIPSEEITNYPLRTPLVDIGFRPEGTSLVATVKDGKTVLWDPATMASPIPLTASLTTDSQVTMARLSQDGRRLVAVESPGRGRASLLSVRDIPSGREILRRNLGKSYLPSISLSPDGGLLATAGDSRLLNLHNGKEISLPQRHSLAVAFSSDGNFLVTAGAEDGQILTRNGKIVRHLARFPSTVHLATFSPDGRRLATASLDHSIRLWDTATGRALKTLEGHVGRVTCLTFSPDGLRLVSGSDDASVKIWDSESGLELFDLRGHSGAISALAFSPGDGKWLATAGIDGIIRLEPMRFADLVAMARSRLSRLTASKLPRSPAGPAREAELNFTSFERDSNPRDTGNE